MKHSLPDMLLRQFMGAAVDRLLSDVLEQIAEAATFLKWWTGHDPLNQLPSLIIEEIVDHRGSRCRGSHVFRGTRTKRQGMRNCARILPYRREISRDLKDKRLPNRSLGITANFNVNHNEFTG